MINQICLEQQWIRKKQEEMRSDPILIEKVIRALLLLEQLQINGLDFVFKGGTSLLLLLSKPARFSIDIDILTTENKHRLHTVIETIVGKGLFSAFKEDIREGAHDIPKAHYKLFFNSAMDQKYPSYILLDVLFERSVYPETQMVSIQSVFTDTTEPIIKD